MDIPGRYDTVAKPTLQYEELAWGNEFPAMPNPDPHSIVDLDSMRLILSEAYQRTLTFGDADAGYGQFSPDTDPRLYPQEHTGNEVNDLITAAAAQIERGQVAYEFTDGYPQANHRAEEIEVAKLAAQDLQLALVFDDGDRIVDCLQSVERMRPGRVDVARLGFAIDVLIGSDDEFSVLPQQRELEEYRRGLREMARISLQRFVQETYSGMYSYNRDEVKGGKARHLNLNSALPVVAEAERLRSFPDDPDLPEAFQQHRINRLVHAIDGMRPSAGSQLPVATRRVCHAAITASERLKPREQQKLARKIGGSRFD